MAWRFRVSSRSSSAMRSADVSFMIGFRKGWVDESG
jgi:hypothetical protein